MNTRALVLIFASLILGGCQLDDPTEVINSKEIIVLDAVDAKYNVLTGKQTLLADSSSACIIRVTLNDESDGAKEILLSTTEGILTNVGHSPTATSTNALTVTPLDREIFVQLNALDIAKEKVIVSAVVNNVSSVLAFDFGFKYPEEVQIQPLHAVSTATTEVEFSLSAITKFGKISEGHYVRVAAEGSAGISLDYPEFVRISDQKAKFKIKNVTEKLGTATIRIRTPLSAMDSVTNMLTITYQ